MGEGRIDILGIRDILLPSYTIGSFVKDLHERMGDEVFDSLYEAGKAHGELAVNEMARENKMSEQEFITKAADTAEVMGMGKFTVRELQMDKRATVELEDSPIVEVLKELEMEEEIDRPVDSLIAGILQGISSEIIREGEVEVRETQCEFLGADHCEFIITRKQ